MAAAKSDALTNRTAVGRVLTPLKVLSQLTKTPVMGPELIKNAQKIFLVKYVPPTGCSTNFTRAALSLVSSTG